MQGKVPFVSSDGIHQLHTFIFVPAVFHILYSILTMALGRAKVIEELQLFLLAKDILLIGVRGYTLSFIAIRSLKMLHRVETPI